jgi:hypothetical protein
LNNDILNDIISKIDADGMLQIRTSLKSRRFFDDFTSTLENAA